MAVAGASSRRQGFAQAQAPETDRAASVPPVGVYVQEMVDKAIQRGLVGLGYISLEDTKTGATPADVLYARGPIKLYHYRPQTDEVYRLPLLIVTSLVSKPYILDLTPGQSLVEFLVQQGFDTYLLDWGVPRKQDSGLRLEDYALDFLPDCVQHVLDESGEDEVSILGYCLGGTIGLIYGATVADPRVANYIFLTTPLDFRRMGMFSTWTDERYFDVDRLVDSLGNVPGEFLFSAFDMLRPAGRVAGQMRVWDRMQDDDYVRSFVMLDRWAADQIPFAGECFRQLTKDLLWRNALLEGTLTLGGLPVNLQQVTQPVIHVTAEHDHIVPKEASTLLTASVGSEDKEDLVLKGGHASLVAGGNARYRLWPHLDKWVAARSV